jgi:cellulose synthase/poly-beta-1,6-N-acetylglucosamine synthase-like glycosyltransferase
MVEAHYQHLPYIYRSSLPKMVPVLSFTLIGCFIFIVYGTLIDYYRRAWTAIPVFEADAQTRQTRQTRISVLIPARNEAANIAACIESLFSQTYPRHLYEVIVIDDHSTDGTAEIVKGLPYPSPALRCLRLTDPINQQRPVAYKKLAIDTGIRAATGELIVTTDADCLFHPEWLSTIAAFYEEKGAKFIAAPVRIGSVPRGFLSIFQTLDFITLQGITGASVYKKFHTMCNGANLAYEKSAFVEVGGFEGIDAIPSGDDMLLMHKIYEKYPEKVLFLKSPNAIVSTRPETTWKGFFNQRIRWASKADRYDDKRIFRVLLLVYIVNLMFVILPVAGIWNSWWLWLLLIGLLTKTALEFPFVYAVAGFFDQQSLMRWFPLLQPFHIFYTVVIGWMGKFASYRWKDRKITK